MAPTHRLTSWMPPSSSTFSTTPYSRMLAGSRHSWDMGRSLRAAASAPTVLP